jgi:polysaccharide biosynthesis protein PslA
MNRMTPKLQNAVRHQAVENRNAPSLERRRLRAYLLMLLADGVVFQLCFALAGLLWDGRWWETRAMLAAQAMLPVYFTLALYNGTYGVKALSNWLFAVRKALIALALSAALLNFVAFYTKSNDDFSRAAVTLGFLFTAVMLAALRRLVALFIVKHWNGQITNRMVIDDGGASFPFDGAEVIRAADYNLDPGSHDPFMLDRLGKLLRNQDKVVVSWGCIATIVSIAQRWSYRPGRWVCDHAS